MDHPKLVLLKILIWSREDEVSTEPTDYTSDSGWNLIVSFPSNSVMW